MVVENIGGGGGMTGAARVARAAPDGYQILFGGGGNLTYNQILYKKPPYNSITDFTPVGLLTQQSLVLIARKDLAADGLPDFIRSMKGNRNATFGSAGAGSSTHLGRVMLNLAIGADATHVPYRGAALALQDLIGGRIDYICDLVQEAVPQIHGGGVKTIAMLARDRSPSLPELPTAAEQGLPGFDTSGWYGLFVPKGTPSSIVRRLNDAAVAALDTPPLRERLHALGVDVVAPDRRSPDYLGRFLKADIEKWTAPIKASGMTAD